MARNKLIAQLSFIILGILMFFISHNQQNYLPGYVIKLDGDTLHGFIDYRNWDKNPETIFFKESLEGNKLAYTPLTIKSFSANNEKYVGAVVDTEVSSTRKNDLSNIPALHTRKATSFLLALIEGPKSLYLHKNPEGNTNFYIYQNGEFELLVYKKYNRKQDFGLEHKIVVVENKKYIGQLTVYLHDCASIQAKLLHVKYMQSSLEKLFLHYYKCTQSKIQFHKEKEKPMAEFGALAGFSVSSIKFKGLGRSDLQKFNNTQSTNLTGGLFLDLILPRNQRKFSFYNELLFTSFRYKVDYSVVYHENSYYFVDNEFAYSYLKLNTLFRFTYPLKSTFLFANVGISNGYAVSEINDKAVERVHYSTHEFTTTNILNSTRKYEQGYIGGLGARFKNYSLEFRYERGNGMSTFTGLNSVTTRYYLLMGYRF